MFSLNLLQNWQIFHIMDYYILTPTWPLRQYKLPMRRNAHFKYTSGFTKERMTFD